MGKLDEDLKALTASAEFDQSVAAMLAMARNTFTYLSSLTEAGFRAPNAFRLTRDFHFLMLAKSLWPDTPPAFGGDDK